VSNIAVSNITITNQDQIIKILGLIKELCSVDSAFIYFRNANSDYLVTTEDENSDSLDSFYVLYKQVISHGIEICKENLDQTLSFFKGIPIYNQEKEVFAALCLVKDGVIELNSFQSDSLDIFLSSLSSCFSFKGNSTQEKDSNFDLMHICSPYFLVFDNQAQIIEVGSNFYKSISSIEKGKSLFDFFFT
jgi:hypothetical protein